MRKAFWSGLVAVGWALVAAPSVLTAADLGTIEGRVLAGDTGRPLSGVLVTAYSDERGEARSDTTDRAGAFAIASLRAGRYFVDFTAPAGSRYASEAMFVQDGENRGGGIEVRVGAGKTRRIEHRLAAGAEIELRFEDSAGVEWDPTGGEDPSVLIVQSYADGAQRRLHATGMHREGSPARLVFRGLPRSKTVAVLVHVPGYVGLHCPAGDLEPGQRQAVVALLDREDPTGIEGYVSPAAKVEIISEPNGHLLSEARADAEGRFAISGLRPSTYGLRVNSFKEGLVRVTKGEKTQVDLRDHLADAPLHLPTLPPRGGEREEVRLELVVRDGRGKAVRDLQVEDLELFEDGIPQTITRLRHVDRAKVEGEVPAHLSVVVDQISITHWPAAMQTANDLIDRLVPGSTAAAFRLDGGISAIVPVTTNADAARMALEAAEPTLPVRSAHDVPDALTADAVRGLRSFGPQARDHRALYSLLAIAEAHAGIPGRKAIVFMCEGLSLSTEHEGLLDSVVAAANRVGVSVYAIDLRGMDAEQQMAAAQDALVFDLDVPEGQWMVVEDDEDDMAAVEEVLEAAPPSALPAVVDWTSLTAPRADERAVLETLAAGTGAFVIANNEYLEQGIEWIAEDLRRYNEITYVPQDRSHDEGYRHIELRVHVRGARAQYRDGYLALPAAADGPLLTYEIPLLRAQGREQAGFPLSIATFSFGGEDRNVRVAWSSQVPLTETTFVPQPPEEGLQARLSFMTLVRDSQDAIVFKRSHVLPLTRFQSELAAMAGQSIQFVEHAALPPGQYSIETLVHDVGGERVARARQGMVVSPTNPRFEVGSLVVAAGFMTPTVPDPTDPFQANPFRVVPASDGTLVPLPGARTLPVYLVVDSMSEAAPPRLTLEVTLGGRRVASETLDLPLPDRGRTIRYVSGLPLEGLREGTYRVRAMVTQGGRGIERTTTLRLLAPQPPPADALRIAEARPIPALPPAPHRTGRVLLDEAEEQVALGKVAGSPTTAKKKSHKKLAVIATTSLLGIGGGVAALAARADSGPSRYSVRAEPEAGIAAATMFQLLVPETACSPQCTWSFGDGAEILAPSRTTHVYEDRGEYAISVAGEGGAIASGSVLVDNLTGRWSASALDLELTQTGSHLEASMRTSSRACNWSGRVEPASFLVRGRCWPGAGVSSGNDPGESSLMVVAVSSRHTIRVALDGRTYTCYRR